MAILDTIAAKRDGRENSREQLWALAQGAADKSVPDYQLSAWLMAAFLNGLNPRETADLTMAMADSGERLDLSSIPGPHLDKHSTGGVGDKTTLVVLPILAACGVTMVKMSGRGLGITGGTIDKLESVPGFRTDLTPEEMIDQAKRIGIALSGQTPRLAPADGALYALRDVTGTVASIPLITASILSKKIAGGAETVVLDVKCGSGAFMKTLPEAEALARSLVDTGKLCGLKVSAVITDMDQPLGMAVGNANEVVEAMMVLGSKNIQQAKLNLTDPLSRFKHLCVALAGHALEVLRLGDQTTAQKALISGKAHAIAVEWFRAQGVSPETIDLDKILVREDGWNIAKLAKGVAHKGGWGFLKSIDAERVGEAVIKLGGGRAQKGQTINHRVGVTIISAVGHRVTSNAPVFTVHGDDEGLCEEVARDLQDAFVVTREPVEPVDPILKVVH